MKDHEFKALLKKYHEGTSSLNEEQLLREQSKKIETLTEQWAVFVEKNITSTPQDLNKKLWDSFEENTQNKNKMKSILPIILSLAACLILVISITQFNSHNTQQSNTEKEELLSQALELFSEPEIITQDEYIFYENDMIIVYSLVE